MRDLRARIYDRNMGEMPERMCMNLAQRQAIAQLRALGFLVVVWSPTELNGLTVNAVTCMEDAVVQAGEDFLMDCCEADSQCCPACDGTGEGITEDARCSSCNGRGEFKLAKNR